MEDQSLNISLARHALLFSDESCPIFTTVENTFNHFINNLFLAFIKENKIEEHYEELGSKQKKSLLRTPEVINRLLWQNDFDQNQLKLFFLYAIEMEKAKLKKAFDYAEYSDSSWALDGSFFINHTGNNNFETFSTPYLSDTKIPIDCFSAYNRVDEEHMPKEWLSTTYDYSEAEEMTDNLTRVYEMFDPIVKCLIQKHIYTLLLRKIPGKETLFTSGSDGGYIGRVLICNGHTVEDSVIVDALVHEAIHGLLYMIDELNVWQPSREVSNEMGRTVISPWSNNSITIRNLVQAIYVWYGLYNFWEKYGNAISATYRNDRLKLISKGFLLLDLAPYKEILNEKTFAELCLIKNGFA
ncbi:hypothetical protein [Chryseobacterium indologenes]|uniref:HEXXH motif domain n=1 Tax=Chryseobacterium indologenes TaxID=253 RepID=A0A0N0ZT88_CHRID|nr:hypothetical protein [Chryseobacterium indologenes]KPE49440.1 hypothetical protein AOB46_19920 [Chryseobacterium indologenes]